MRYVFITGSPRTGTTALRSILNSHDDIEITHEKQLPPPQDYNTKTIVGDKTPIISQSNIRSIHLRVKALNAIVLFCIRDPLGIVDSRLRNPHEVWGAKTQEEAEKKTYSDLKRVLEFYTICEQPIRVIRLEESAHNTKLLLTQLSQFLEYPVTQAIGYRPVRLVAYKQNLDLDNISQAIVSLRLLLGYQ